MRSSTELAWPAACAVLAAGSVVVWWAPTAVLDWQPTQALAEPWRLVSAAWVHWSSMHLLANLAGVVLVALLGAAARVPPAATLAWLLAWPLTHAGLWVQPALAHYGGASGVLHAAVAVVVVWLVATARSHRRAVGAAIGAGLLVKVLEEAPWAGPLAHPRGWDIATAPIAHASGALAGVVCALGVLGVCALMGVPTGPREAN